MCACVYVCCVCVYTHILMYNNCVYTCNNGRNTDTNQTYTKWFNNKVIDYRSSDMNHTLITIKMEYVLNFGDRIDEKSSKLKRNNSILYMFAMCFVTSQRFHRILWNISNKFLLSRESQKDILRVEKASSERILDLISKIILAHRNKFQRNKDSPKIFHALKQLIKRSNFPEKEKERKEKKKEEKKRKEKERK